MRCHFGYIRVSTVRQGQQGVSLQEQRDAILRYASRSGLTITQWFEEQETAAKQGRPVFGRMLRLLMQHKADGVILHKIDRGARNLKDWARINDLTEAGLEVHFANDGLNLQSRGGRLSADIQAVVAADFIRNLREETRKGFDGRLKQGLYPLPAPVGYLDRGKGQPKVIDPITGPLVRQGFELYASGRYNLERLVDEMFQRGLRNRQEGKVTRNGWSTILNNPFYFGLIHIKKTNETHRGAHEPLISKLLFDRVHAILSDKSNAVAWHNEFLYRRLLTCGECGLSLIAERQKGHVYYRCHTKTCQTTGIREEPVTSSLKTLLSQLRFTSKEMERIHLEVTSLKADWVRDRKSRYTGLQLQLDQATARLNRLTDAFLDGSIGKPEFEQRKATLLMEQKGVEDALVLARQENHSVPEKLEEILELANRAWLSFELGNPEEKRELVKRVTSNRTLTLKNLSIEPSLPFSEIQKRNLLPIGDPQRDRPRTLDELLETISAWLEANPKVKFPVFHSNAGHISTNPNMRTGWYAKLKES